MLLSDRKPGSKLTYSHYFFSTQKSEVKRNKQAGGLHACLPLAVRQGGSPFMLAVSAADLAISVVNRLLNAKEIFVLLEHKQSLAASAVGRKLQIPEWSLRSL